MPLMKKYYFSRVQHVAIFAEAEEDARLQLGQDIVDSEDFILDDVRDCVPDGPGQWRVIQ